MEKKTYTQEEVDQITGSTYAEAYNAGLKDNGHLPQPKDPAWVKASERLPGYTKQIKWRYAGKESTKRDGSLRTMLNTYGHLMENWEWLDKSGSNELVAENVRLTAMAEALQEQNAHMVKITLKERDELQQENERLKANITAAAGREDWIDVNDRLPYKDGDSSVYCLVNDTYDGIVVRPFNEAHLCWDQEDGDDYYTDAKGGKITHWKPLPEPPKRKEQKEK